MANAKPKPTMRCRGNSWYVPYDTISSREKERGSHPATFPIALVEQCIKFGTKMVLLLIPLWDLVQQPLVHCAKVVNI